MRQYFINFEYIKFKNINEIKFTLNDDVSRDKKNLWLSVLGIVKQFAFKNHLNIL